MRKILIALLFFVISCSNFNTNKIVEIKPKIIIGNKENIIENNKNKSNISEKDKNKIDEILNNINFEKVIVKVKLSYKNPKIIKKGEFYYVNGKAYRGMVYLEGSNVINEIELEEYLYSVVPSEMAPYFDIEALKAQSVAARTFTLYSIKNHKAKSPYYDLDDTVIYQVYKGVSSENDRTTKAVNATKGEIMLDENINPILAQYHSSSGDKTLSSKEVFGKEVSYLQSVKDYSESKKWEYKISKKSLETKFRKKYSKISKLENSYIRKKMGYSKIKSNNFYMKLKNGYVYFYGKGFGHNVGMSQWGAKYLAEEKKYNYIQILKHYYTNIDIIKIGEQ